MKTTYTGAQVAAFNAAEKAAGRYSSFKEIYEEDGLLYGLAPASEEDYSQYDEWYELGPLGA